MYILLAIIAGAVIGAALHMAAPGRDLRGRYLSGSIGAASAAVIYSAFTWLGVGEANVWTWVASIGGSFLITFAITVVLTRTRAAHDVREDQELGAV